MEKHLVVFDLFYINSLTVATTVPFMGNWDTKRCAYWQIYTVPEGLQVVDGTVWYTYRYYHAYGTVVLEVRSSVQPDHSL